MTVTFGYTTTTDEARICYVTEPGPGTPALHILQSLYPCASVLASSSGQRRLTRGLSANGMWLEFDWRGSGKSTSPTRPITFEHLVHDVEAVAAVIQEPFDVIAVNDGCKAALVLASRRPELVRRLLLTAPVGAKAPLSESYQRSIPAWGVDMVYNLASFLKWVHPGTDEEETFQIAKAAVEAKPPEVAVELATAFLEVDLLAFASDVAAPAFVLYTGADGGDALDLAAAMPNARAVNWTTIGDGTINGVAWRQAWDEAFPPPPSTRPAAAAPSLNGSLAANGAARLSARELEALRLLVAGNSNKAIADALTVSLPTVATHVRHILEKTTSAIRTEAATWALKNGLL